MGIRLPCRHHNKIFVWRRRIALGRLRLVSRQFKRPCRESWHKEAKRLGALRHARQCVGMVFRLAPLASHDTLRRRESDRPCGWDVSIVAGWIMVVLCGTLRERRAHHAPVLRFFAVWLSGRAKCRATTHPSRSTKGFAKNSGARKAPTKRDASPGHPA